VFKMPPGGMTCDEIVLADFPEGRDRLHAGDGEPE